MKLPYRAKKTFDKKSNDIEYISLTHNFMKKLEKISDPIERAQLAHKEIDSQLQEILEDKTVKQELSCQKGCHFCCHYEIGITEEEGQLLAQEMAKGAYFNHLLHKYQKKKLARGTNWDKMPFNKQRCPFLKPDNSCSVYENRPSVCRTNMAISPPSTCQSFKGNHQQKLMVKTFKADMIVMALFLSSRKRDSLSRILGQILIKLDAIITVTL